MRNTLLDNSQSNSHTKSDLLKLVLLYATLTTLMYFFLVWSGHDERGICTSLSASTIDKLGGYAISIGVAPCPTLPTQP